MNDVNANIPPVVSSQPQNYFDGESKNELAISFQQKLKRFWENFQYYARQVWPWVNRLINFIVYEIIKVLKAIVRIALSQVGLMKD